jgi:hypothetical protein
MNHQSNRSIGKESCKANEAGTAMTHWSFEITIHDGSGRE